MGRWRFEIGRFQQCLAIASVLGLDQRFEQIVQVAFDSLAKHETVIPWKRAGVITRPQDQVVGRGDDRQFIAFLYRRPPSFQDWAVAPQRIPRLQDGSPAFLQW